MAAKIFAVLAMAALAFDGGAAHASSALPRFQQLEPNVAFWGDVFTKYGEDQIIFHDPYHLDLVYSILDLSDIVRTIESPATQEREIRKRRTAEEHRVKEMLSRLSRSAPRNAEEEALLRKIARFNHEARYASVLADRIRSQRGLANKFCPAMERAHAYMPGMKKILAAQGVPEELAALPLVESSYQIGAHSSAGAAGIWQFTYGTGRLFLKVDGYRDERRDPLKATEAAAALLRQNYDKLGAWPLAITAYNHGSAGMARAVRTVGSEDLGIISESYKSRTFGFASRNFYAEFLAAADAVARAEDICGKISVPAYQPDHFELDAYVGFADLVATSGMSEAELAEYNPALRPGVLSGAQRVPKGYRLNLPPGKRHEFAARYASLPASARFSEQPETRYRVHSGETLSHIARKHGTSVSALLSFNGLRDPRRLRAGQVIKIPSRASTVPSVRITTTKSAADEPRNSRPVAVSAAAGESGDGGGLTSHRVGRGQTLSQIARMYKSTVPDLQRLNGIDDPKNLRTGQTLRVPARGVAVASADSPAVTRTHRVGSGETLWSIAKDYRTSIDTLQRLSGIRNPSRLRVGQVITVPDSGEEPAAQTAASGTHQVQKGQTLSQIAEMYSTSVSTLKRVNGIRDPRKLRPGQMLKVP